MSLIRVFALFLMLLTALLSTFAEAGAEEKGFEGSGTKIRYSFLAGYGVTHPGLGKTKQYVETLDLFWRYEKELTGRRGSSWYRGYHSLFVEWPVHLVTDPDFAPISGLDFLANWTFTNFSGMLPYVFAGGGPLYTAADIPGMSTRWVGNWQYGFGVRWAKGEGRFMQIEYRFHHISNGGRKEPNDPLNGSKLLFGISF